MKQSFINSVRCSFNGLSHVIKKERNFKIQIMSAVVVIFLGWEAKLTRTEWAILLLTIAFILSMELMNTCIEKIMDLLHPQYSEKVKIIKDIAAGAVTIACLFSIAIGAFLFYKLVF